MRISVTPVSASPARIAAGIGVAPRCRGSSDGWRFRAPCCSSSSSARDDLPVVGEDQQLGFGAAWIVRERFRGAQAYRASGPARSRARRPRPLATRRTPGAVTTPTRSIVVVAIQTPQALAPEAATPRKTVRTRASSAAPPVRPRSGHARAPVASRTSASSSLLAADQHQLVHGVEVVDVELALEMVELVLERPAQAARTRPP